MLAKIKQFCWCNLKIWTAPIVTSSNVSKHNVVLLKWLENLNCLYYQKLKLSQKQSNFVEVIWKFELLLWSQTEIFAKTRQFYWSDSKIWTATIITGWNFLKNKAVLMISPENLNFPCYHELKFLQKYPIFNEVI